MWTAEDVRDAKLPGHGSALIRALRFSEPDFSGLQNLTEPEWQKLLGVTDSTQITLLLGHLCGSALPLHIQTRIIRDGSNNAKRLAKLKSSLNEIAGRLEEKKIDFCLLKGLAHSPHFSRDPLLRSQGDIDLWCLESQLTAAYEVLLELGYRPYGKSKGRHLDPMIREKEWEWSGDYFDPDLPNPVDLHFTLWDQKLELVPGPCEEQMWHRRTCLVLEGREIPTLDKADALTFAALHLMMHLLHGDLRLQRAWEIGHFLQTHACDDAFWSHWQSLYSPEVCRLQFVAFALANRWFACTLSPLIAEQVAALPDDLSFWLKRYGLSPLEGLFTPNKDEVWLHLCLLPSFRDKARVFFRRLVPLHAVPISSAGSQSTESLRAPSGSRTQFFLRRFVHHLRALLSISGRSVEWWWLRQRFTREFSLFLFLSILFDFGEFIFFLLYNLYLLDLGPQ